MPNNRHAWLVFKKILLILFVLFLMNYYQVASGNYRNSLTNKTILTEDKIKEFEEDVKNGEYIDIKNYTEEEYIDTRNPISKIGSGIGGGIDQIVNEKAGNFFNFIKKYFF